MNRKLILTIVATAIVALNAFSRGNGTVIINAAGIEHIAIAGDLQIILAPANGNQSSFEVDPDLVNHLNLHYSGNSLSIEPSDMPGSKKITVYLYVNGLRSLTIEHAADVRTEGVINAPKLDLWIGGSARVHLKTNGTVNPMSMYDDDLKVMFKSKRQPVTRSLAKANK